MNRQTTTMLLGLVLVGCTTRPIVTLDEDARARSISPGLTLATSQAEFDRMRRDYDPGGFDIWSNRLRLLRPGMSRAEVLSKLNSESGREVCMDIATVTGSGQHEIWILDDAYCAYLTFSFEMTDLQGRGIVRRDSDQLTHVPASPTAIRYRVQ